MEGQDSYAVLYKENLHKSLEEPVIQYNSGKCNQRSNHVQIHSMLLCVIHFLFTANTKMLLI